MARGFRRRTVSLCPPPAAKRPPHIDLESLESRLLLSTYFVATTGSDSQAGTVNAPFASLLPFFAIAQPGDAALIRGGTYRGFAGSDWSRQYTTIAGTAAAPITIAGYPGENVLIDSGTPGGNFTFLTLSRSNAYLNFDNLHFSNFMVAFNLYAETGYEAPHHITFTNSEFAYSGNQTMPGNDGKPIRLTGGAHDITIRNSDFHHVAGPGVYGLGNVYNVLIENSVSHDNNDYRSTSGDADGFTFTNAALDYPRNITFRNVMVWNTSEDGIDVKGDNIVEENVTVWNVGANAFKAWSPAAENVQGHFTFNNVVGFAAGQTVMEAFYHPDITLTNSILVGNDDSPFKERAHSETTFIYKAYSSDDPAGPWSGRLYSRNNIFMHLGASTTNAVVMELHGDNTVLDMDGDTIYSRNTPNYVVGLRRSGVTRYYSNDRIASGEFYAAQQIEQHVSSRQMAVAPVAALLPLSGSVPLGQVAELTAVGADPAGQALTYSWTLGDGAAASVDVVNHLYGAIGTYNISLTARNSSGQAATKTGKVFYGVPFMNAASPAQDPVAADFSVAPLARADWRSTNRGTPVLIDVLANDTDANGDALAVTRVTTPANGSVVNMGNGSVTYWPAAEFVGTDRFTYTVSDGHGQVAWAEVQVMVQAVNRPPLALDDQATVSEDGVILLPVLANDSDPDADLLTVAAVSPAAHGSVVVANDQSIAYTPQANWYGLDAFTYTVRDAWGRQSTAHATITVLPVNDAPVARADDASAIAGEPVAVAVLANDGDADGDAVTVLIWSQPAHGNAAATADGTFIYTPDAAYSGSDSFRYVITDGHGGSAAAQVLFNVVADNSDQAALVADGSWTSADVGGPALAGTTLADGTGGYTLTGGGSRIWGTSDQFHYYYAAVSGDATIIARVNTLDAADPFAKAGLMIRQSLDAASSQVMMSITAGEGSGLYYRDTAGGWTQSVLPGDLIAAPAWLKLVRTGDLFCGYVSLDGVNWTLVGTAAVDMSQTVLIGLALTPRRADSLATATFSDLSIGA